MSKFKVTAQVEGTLKRLAKQLEEHFGPEAQPLIGAQTHLLTEQEARNSQLAGVQRLLDGRGAPLGPNQRVAYQRQVLVGTAPVNHYRRMKRAYERGGEEAVKAYLAPYTQAAAPHNTRKVARIAERIRAAAPDATIETVRPKLALPEPVGKSWLGRLWDKVRALFPSPDTLPGAWC